MLPIIRTIRLNPYNKLLHRNVKFATSILVSSGIETEWVTNQRGEKYFLKRQNDKFEKFFSEQKTCETEEEWKNCLEVMRTDLPQAFRLNSSRKKTTVKLRNILKESHRNEVTEKPWAKGVFQHNESRWELLNSTTGIHEFICNERLCGNISRQELVSMIPVFLLDVQPHHRILDMCASPGSKTKHVLEIMHAKLNANCSKTPKKLNIPSGFVIGNEIDVNRCDKLKTNVTQFSSPCLILVNHDAQDFPEFPKDPGSQEFVKYDRIVCDVPCSGDGTIRKNPTVWSDWSPAKGNSRHSLQFNIVERGAELLEINGIMAYSSCAINPIENEAVIARLLKVSEGALELIDCSKMLQGFKYAPGFTNWKVFGNDMNEYDHYEQVPDALKYGKQIHCGMFPDGDFNKKNNVDFCLRMLPHHNNDGGFFAAMVKKVKPLPWEKEHGIATPEEFIQSKNWPLYGSRVKKNIVRDTYEDPILPEYKPKKPQIVKGRKGTQRKIRDCFVNKKEFFQFFIEGNDNQIQAILDFYGIDCQSELFFKSGEKAVYMTNQAIKDIVQASDERHNIFTGGVKVFKELRKRDCSMSHTMTLNGRNLFLDFISDKRKVEICSEEMSALLDNCGTFSDEDRKEKNVESVVFRDILRPNSIKTIEDMIEKSGLGPVSFVYQDINILAYVGQYKITNLIERYEKYHARIMLDL